MPPQLLRAAQEMKHAIFVGRKKMRDRVPIMVRRHLEHRRRHGRFAYIPGMRRPSTFTEKLLWRILRDRREILRRTCDKLWMKDFGESRGVSSPQTYWHGVDPIKLAEASHKFEGRWVLKPNHLSGPVHFHEGPISPEKVAAVTDGWLSARHAPELGEWATRFAEPCLLAEELLAAEDGMQIPDYKFFVFDGRPEVAQLIADRFGDSSHTYYWLPSWERINVEGNRPPAAPVEAPKELPGLLEAAASLGQGWDFMRVDLYASNGQVWLGELTPYPASARFSFSPAAFDQWLGDQWALPRKRK